MCEEESLKMGSRLSGHTNGSSVSCSVHVPARVVGGSPPVNGRVSRPSESHDATLLSCLIRKGRRGCRSTFAKSFESHANGD